MVAVLFDSLIGACRFMQTPGLSLHRAPHGHTPSHAPGIPGTGAAASGPRGRGAKCRGLGSVGAGGKARLRAGAVRRRLSAQAAGGGGHAGAGQRIQPQSAGGAAGHQFGGQVLDPGAPERVGQLGGRVLRGGGQLPQSGVHVPGGAEQTPPLRQSNRGVC